MILDLALLDLMSSSFFGAVIALFTLTLFGWALFPALQGFLLRLEPDHSIVVLSLNNSTSYLGLGTGAVLGTLVIGAGHTSALPYISCAVAVLALASWLIINRASRRVSGLGAEAPAGGAGGRNSLRKESARPRDASSFARAVFCRQDCYCTGKGESITSGSIPFPGLV
jgi:hypothetical protein